MRNQYTVEALAQREEDHQRWADDGGITPDEVLLEMPADRSEPESPFVLPVRLVYHRRDVA